MKLRKTQETHWNHGKIIYGVVIVYLPSPNLQMLVEMLEQARKEVRYLYQKSLLLSQFLRVIWLSTFHFHFRCFGQQT